jgi:hypothetical protein
MDVRGPVGHPRAVVSPSSTTRSGSTRVTWPAPSVMLTVIEGFCGDEQAAIHTREARAAYARGLRLHHFFDVEGMTNYASSARVELTRFAIEHRAHVASATFLVRHRLVAMGVSTAALAARLVGLDFHILHDRGQFERLIDRAKAR